MRAWIPAIIAGGTHSYSMNPIVTSRVPGQEEPLVGMRPTSPYYEGSNDDITVSVGWNIANEVDITRECTAWSPGRAFYRLNDVDFTVSADDATFFDPHVSYGMTSALEPVGLACRFPLDEVMRWALVGLDEWMSDQRAHQIGLVTELVPYADLWDHVDALAKRIAAKPAVTVQSTVKAVWGTWA